MKKFVLCILIALSVLSVNVSYAENAEYVDSILSTVSNMYSENATEWEILDMAAYGAMDMLSADDVDEYSREAHQLAETSSKATDKWGRTFIVKFQEGRSIFIVLKATNNQISLLFVFFERCVPLRRT